MSGAGINVSVDTSDALNKLAGYLARIAQPRGMYERIGASLVTSTQRRFETGIGPDGSPWPPSLRVLAHGGKTLVLSARLMQSQTFIASEQGVEVGSNAVYAAIHQLGGVIRQAAREAVLHFKHNARTGRTRFAKANSKANYAKKAQIGARVINMPARPFLGLDAEDDREIIAIAEDWIAKEARQ
jgi:phage virion morphogenesis protein